MKTLQWAAAALAVGALALPARADTSATTDWWDVTFEDGSFQDGFEGLTVGELGSLTNDETKSQCVQPYASGVWTMIDGDESYVTNEFNPTNLPAGMFGDTTCIKLDTQGNDLTWTPTVAVTKLSYLVDADLYLVGSDSAPDASDFDADSDVQAAIYLKNETNEDTGETTNSVLCVYVFDEVKLNNYWQELEGVKLDDNSWAHVQVVVDHSGTKPLVKVFVNGTQMTARNGSDDFWVTANRGDSFTAGKVSSVSFRGTGAVDNFVGKTLTEKPFNFTAQVYINDVPQDSSLDGNGSRTVSALAGEGRMAEFPSFAIDDYNEPPYEETTYALARIVILDPVTGDTVATYNYTYDAESITATADVDDSANVAFSVDENGDPDGGFTVFASTAGATADATIALIYFEDLPEEGTYNAKATTTIGETTTTDSKKVRPSEFAEPGATKTVTWTFPAEKNGNLLSTVQVYEGATLTYENKTATVSVTLDAALAADTLFAAATYVEGSLAEGYDLDPGEPVDGLYTFRAFIPPVAIYVAGGETHEYPSLRAAVAAASLLAEPVTIQLVADDAVSFTAENPILDIDFEVTIDGGSNTLYGLSAFAGEGYNEVRIGGSGNVTIKDLAFSEFGDTAPLSGASMPICTRSTYTGMLTLDGVTIDKFNRQAVLLCGGEFFVTNCTITGCAGSGKTSYFQSAFENYFAAGTIVDTTVTGIGALDAGTNDEGDPWAAAVFTVNPAGNGSYTVLSGDYEGQFIVAANLNSTGSVILSNGTFVATAPKTNEVEGVQTPVSAFLLEGNVAVTVAGGWYDREPEEGFIADGLAAYEDAPGTDAPWTVRAEKFTITFMNGATKLDEIEVQKNGAVAYAGETPVKEGTDQYSYTFAGWSTTDGGEALESLPAATADATYYAVFTESVNKYEVEWIVDGVYSTNEWDYGATPSYDGTNNPTKASTAATNFTFNAWDPAVVAVTGFASYTATWTETAREYAVTFKTNGVVYATVQAEWNATDYAPAAPAAPDGKVFKGWAAEEAPTTVLETLPAISGEATYVAVFDDDVVEPPEVDVGDNLLAADGAPMEFAADGKCTVRFRAPATGVYVLLSSTTVNGTYVADEAASATKTVTDLEDNLVELTEGTAGTTKFFKIGWSAE